MEEFKRFNDDQKKAYCTIMNYINTILHNPDNHLYYLLNGPGGSGKTHIISNILKNIDLKFKVLAPTHKACSILKKTYHNTNTIAKFLGYKEEIDNYGNTIITYNPHIDSDIDLLIIDECSMISSRQLLEIQKTNINVLFIGDKYQLNPINEDESSVFSLEFYGTSELTKNERIKNEISSSIILDFRKSVQKNYMLQSCLSNELIITNRKTFDKKLIESFKNDEDTIYIAWTNKSVQKYNELIRKSLFSEDILEYMPTESLIFNKYHISISGERFYTSQKVKISSCTIKNYNIYNPICTCTTNQSIDQIVCKFSNDDNNKIEKCTKCHTPTSLFSYKTFEFYEMTFEGYSDVFLKPVHDIKNIYSILYKHRDKCTALKNKHKWKNYYLLLSHINIPIEYSYAITVHKSQGSSYNNVFIDLENIYFCNDLSEKLKLCYTAVSRSSSNLTILK